MSADTQGNAACTLTVSSLFSCQAAACCEVTFGLLNVGAGVRVKARQRQWPPSPAALGTCYPRRGG